MIFYAIGFLLGRPFGAENGGCCLLTPSTADRRGRLQAGRQLPGLISAATPAGCLTDQRCARSDRFPASGTATPANARNGGNHRLTPEWSSPEYRAAMRRTPAGHGTTNPANHGRTTPDQGIYLNVCGRKFCYRKFCCYYIALKLFSMGCG